MITPPLGVNPMLVFDRFTGFDRGYAGANSKVRDDKSLGQIVSKLAHDRFAQKTTKPIALDPLRPQFLGSRKYPPDFRQIGMKCGIAARCLRRRGKMFPCEVDDRKSRWDMQRRKGVRRFKLA